MVKVFTGGTVRSCDVRVEDALRRRIGAERSRRTGGHTAGAQGHASRKPLRSGKVNRVRGATPDRNGL